MKREYKEYVPPKRNEVLKNLSDGYDENDKKNPKRESKTFDFNSVESVKQRIDNGENVSPIDLLSYGFYQLGESKAKQEAENRAAFQELNNEES
ncbi:hypothetical protein CIB87_21325 [Priestia megaterium]|uniref:Uncharacterized protein n=1 Tax=Priestia megaterium TaxID=1404 RepID=A0AA86I3X4_PRIMG|nr:hypothetical protein [Priestia megaterium]AXI31457.1 hypothetical protein CIB87_21325 [Priestia megaterium]